MQFPDLSHAEDLSSHAQKSLNNPNGNCKILESTREFQCLSLLATVVSRRNIFKSNGERCASGTVTAAANFVYSGFLSAMGPVTKHPLPQDDFWSLAINGECEDDVDISLAFARPDADVRLQF